MSAYNADLALKQDDRPKPQERMSVDEYRAAVGAPPKRQPVARIAMPEPTPQDMVAMAAATWPGVEKLTIELPTPPSLNNAYENTGGNGRRKSKKLIAFYAEATAALSQIGQRLDAETYRAHVVVTRTSPLADIDGKAKFILDVLHKCGLTVDDKHCEKVVIEWRYMHPPGATVMLSRYRKRRAA